MKKKRGLLMTRFFALLIAVVVLLGSIPASATDYADETQNPAAEVADESTQTPTDGDVTDDAAVDDGSSEDPAPADGDDTDVIDRGDGTVTDDAAVNDGDEAADADAEDATVAEDAEDAETEAVPQATPKKKIVKLAKTAAAKDEVEDEDEAEYKIEYKKSASVKSDGDYYFKNLTEIKITVKDVEPSDVSKIRAIAAKETDDPLPEGFDDPDADYELPDYVTKEAASAEKAVTLTIDAEAVIEDLIEDKDGSEKFVVFFTTGKTDGGSSMSSVYRVLYIDEEGPEISAETVEDKWHPDDVSINIKAEDPAGIDEVDSTDGSVDEYEGEGDYTHSLTLTESPSGKVTVTAYDNLGNENAYEIDQQIKIDNADPVLKIAENSKTWQEEQTFVVEATDTQSGIDAESFTFSGGEMQATAVEGTDEYKVTVKADGKLTVKDKVGHSSNEITLKRNIDTVKPTEDNVSVKFFVKSDEDKLLDALLEDIFHIHGDGVYGNDGTLKMRVMVASKLDKDATDDGSPITSIIVKNGDTALTAVGEGPAFDEASGLYCQDFELSVTTESDAVKLFDSVTMTIKDDGNNESDPIKLGDITKIYAGEDTVGKIINKIVNTEIAPLVTNPSYSDDVYTKTIGGTEEKEYFVKSGAKFDLKAEDGVGGIYGVKVYFGTADQFDDQNKPKDESTLVTGEVSGPAGYTVTDGMAVVDDQDNVQTEMQFSYVIPADLASGEYVLYAQAQSFARNTGSFAREIFVDNDAPGIDLKYSYIDDEGAETAYDGTKWVNKPVKVTLTVSDKSVYTLNGTEITRDLSGMEIPSSGAAAAEVLSVVKTAPKKNASDPDTAIELAYEGSVEKDGVTTYTYTFEVASYGEYKVTAADRLKNEDSQNSIGVKVDRIAPEFTGIKFDLAHPDADIDKANNVKSVLRLLSFGLFSNDDIKLTVEGQDANPSSGIEKIEVTVDTAENYLDPAAKSYGAENTGCTGTVAGKADFTLARETLTNDEKVTFIITDTAGNTYSATLKELRTGKNFVTAVGVKLNQTAEIAGGFEVVATGKKPTVTPSIDTTDKNGYYADKDGNLWFSVKNHPELKTTYEIKENNAKLYQTVLTLNGNNVSGDTSSDQGGAIGTEAISYGAADMKIEEDTVSFNPMLSSHKALKKTSTDGDAENGGLNVLEMKATANSGNVGKGTAKFYVDDTAPVITQVTYSGDGRADNPQRIDEDGKIITRIRRNANASKNYGYYFKGNTTMTVTATDFRTTKGETVNGCDVKEIHVYLVPLSASYLSGPRDYTLDGSALKKNDETGEVTASFTMKADFKGQVYVFALDHVDNRSDNYYPDATIAEKSATHDKYSSAGIEIATAPAAKDNKGNDLFDKDVTVTLTVSDTYNGLQSLHYSVASEWAGGTIDEAEVEIGQTDTAVLGWKVLEKDNNLITKVSKTITLDSKSKYNYNDLVIHVDAKDRAGFAINCTDQTISIDTTAPVITLTPRSATSNYYDPDSKNYYQDTLTFDVTVRERNFDPEEFAKVAVITAREGSAPAIDGASDWSKSYSDYGTDSTHTATVSFASDGDYTVELGYTDQAGNVGASVKSEDFVIDTIDPVLSVSFDNNNAANGNYYGTARVATVTVEEHNFAEGDGYITYSLTAFEGDNVTAKSTPQLALSGWGGSGDTHTTTLDFNTDGNYAFTITYKDKAARNANEYKQETFYIDLGIEDNAIVFTKNTENHAFGREQVTPGVTYIDNNIDPANCKASLTRISYDPKDGTQKTTPEGLDREPDQNTATTKIERYKDFPDEEIYDGIYLYKATITDKAGHTGSKQIVFSVNRYGATYMCEDEATQKLLDTGFSNNVDTDLKITEINVTEIKDYSVTSTRGTDIENLAETASGSEGFERKAIAGNSASSWYKYEYTIRKNNFEQEGDYTVTLNSNIVYSDKELNTLVTNRTTRVEDRSFPINFTVDKTEPEITIDGVAANEAYSEAEKNVRIVCADKNIDPATLVIKLNDKALAADQYTMSVLDGEIDIDLPINTNRNQETYDLEVVVGDLAQNVADNDETKNFILSATFLTMFFHNTLAVVLTSVGLAAVIALVILLILRKRRKNA